MFDTLPNCLTSIPKEDRSIGLAGTWFYLYCANCGDPCYRVMDTGLPAQFAFALCNDCVEKYGEPAGVARTPDDVFRQKIQDAMVERYGHILTEQEIMAELENAQSVVSQLERDGRRR